MNKIIILLLLLVLLIMIYKKVGAFQTDTFYGLSISKKQARFIFLDKSESTNIIKSITTFDHYNKLDLKLRGLTENTDLATHYSSKLTDWSQSDKQVMTWLFYILKTRIPKKYEFLFYDIKIAKYVNDVENGFPHTNKDCIFICDDVVREVMKYYNNNLVDAVIKKVGEMIIHECVHIWQRREPRFFVRLYESWGFFYQPHIYNFNKYRKRSRYNPDGLELTWVFNLDTVNEDDPDCLKSTKPRNVIVPAALYRDDAQNISDVNLIGLYLEKIGNTYIISPFPRSEYLANIKEFVEMFGKIASNNYHPNEVAAEIVAISLTEQILNERETSSLALLRYKTVFHQRNYFI